MWLVLPVSYHPFEEFKVAGDRTVPLADPPSVATPSERLSLHHTLPD